VESDCIAKNWRVLKTDQFPNFVGIREPTQHPRYLRVGYALVITPRSGISSRCSSYQPSTLDRCPCVPDRQREACCQDTRARQTFCWAN